jgi:hypothetical protein
MVTCYANSSNGRDEAIQIRVKASPLRPDTGVACDGPGGNHLAINTTHHREYLDMKQVTPRAAISLAALLLALTWAAPSAFAQGDMSFGVDEVEEGTEDGGDGGDGGDGDFSFSEEDVNNGGNDGGSAISGGSDKSGSVAVVAVPTSAIDEEQRQQLQDALDESMKQVKDYDVRGPSGVLGGLRDRDPEVCARETICLAGVGGEAGVNKMVLARITKIGEQYRLDIDFFDVDERLFIKYETVENLGSANAAIKAVDPTIKTLFSIRGDKGGPIVEDKPNNQWIRPVFGYTTAGLAVAGLVGGAVFGNKARQERDAIVNASKNDAGQYTEQSQTDARNSFNGARRTANTANVFYGLGVGMAALSVVFFTVDFGSDVADEDELSKRSIRDFKVAPAVTRDAAGVGTFFRF